MVDDAGRSDDDVRADLAERLQRDRAAGRELVADDYLELFPEHSELVLAELRALANDTVVSPRPEEPTSAISTPTDAGSHAGAPRFVGAHRIEEEIGRGGQGVVYRATDTRLGRIVAVKVLNTWSALTDDVVRRFLREGMIASRLDDPGICAVYETGVEAGVPFIVMRHIDGRTLSRIIRDGGDELDRDTVLERARMVERIARSLHRAHEAGIVHRDVKPGNVMVTEQGDPVILDFGLAGDDSGLLSTLTRTGDMHGTAPYMAPEQIDADAPVRDPRVDVYALGIMLYESVVGRRPYEASTRDALFDRIRNVDPPRLRNTNRNAPRDLETVVETAIEKEPSRRYETALALADDIRCVIDGRPIAARPISAPGRVVRWARRRPALAALVLALAILVAGLFAVGGFLFANLDSIEAQRRQELEDEIERRLAVGFGEMSEGDAEVAIASFDDVLELAPRNESALVGKAMAMRELGRDRDALALLKREGEGLFGARMVLNAIQGLPLPDEAPAYPDAHFFAAEIHIADGHQSDEDGSMKLAMARALEAVLLSPEPRPRYHFTLAHAAGHVGDEVVARRVSAAIAGLWPDWNEARFWAGFALHLVDPGAALARYREIDGDDGASIRVLDNIAWVLHELGRHEETLEVRERLLEMDPDRTSTLFGCAFVLDDLERFDEGVTYLRRALELEPRHVKANHLLGRLLVRAERLEEAVEAWNVCVREFPRSSLAHSNLGLCHGFLGHLDEAEKCFRRSIAIEPTAVGWGNLGYALDEQGRIEEAREAYEASLALDPTDSRSLFRLGFVFDKLGRLEEAVATMRKLVEHHDDHYNNHAALGIMLVDVRRLDEGIACFRRAIELAPRVLWIRDNLADAYFLSGRFEDALDVLDAALELAPRGVRFLTDKVNVLLALDEVEDAFDVARKAVAIEPDTAGVHFSLARCLGRKGRHADAVESYRRALGLDEDHAEAWCNMGLELRTLGRIEEAVDALGRGHRLGSPRRNWKYPSEQWLREAEAELRGPR